LRTVTVAAALFSVLAAEAAPPDASVAAVAPLPSLTDSLSGQAKADYAAALLLYDDEDYAGAVVKFLSAYDASHDARLLWNAAACQKNLRHYAKAMALVERYVDAGAPYVTPANQAEAKTFLDAVAPLTAKLTVVVNEPDATVSVDREEAGKTPLATPVVVDLGAREVAVVKDGFKRFSRVVQINGSRDVEVTADLEKLVHRGRLVVHAGGEDTISFDGRGVGSGTWDSSVASGGHTVRVTAPGMVAYQSEVLVQDGQTRRLDVKLVPTSGGIPAWVWIVGSGVLVAGAATAGYFALRPSDPAPIRGTITPGYVSLSLSR
jgi:hypothetical protein